MISTAGLSLSSASTCSRDPLVQNKSMAIVPAETDWSGLSTLAALGFSGSEDLALPISALAEDAADLTGDGRVDAADFLCFKACSTGPSITYTPKTLPADCTLPTGPDGVHPADFDRDHDVDQDDFGVLQRELGAANVTEPSH